MGGILKVLSVIILSWPYYSDQYDSLFTSVDSRWILGVRQDADLDFASGLFGRLVTSPR